MKRFNVIPTFHNILGAYEGFCKSFCKENDLAQTAFDILMFLENNPECCTAKEIIKHTGLRANLVSLYVVQLWKRGYLEREPVKGNRRCIRLICTERAKAITTEGAKLQKDFFTQLFDGINADDAAVFRAVAGQCVLNLEKIKKANG